MFLYGLLVVVIDGTIKAVYKLFFDEVFGSSLGKVEVLGTNNKVLTLRDCRQPVTRADGPDSPPLLLCGNHHSTDLCEAAKIIIFPLQICKSGNTAISGHKKLQGFRGMVTVPVAPSLAVYLELVIYHIGRELFIQ